MADEREAGRAVPRARNEKVIQGIKLLLIPEGKNDGPSGAVIEIMNFVEQTSPFAAEGSMGRARRPAGIGHRAESLPPHGHVSRDLEDFLPIFMHKGLGGKSPRLKAEQAGPGPSLRFFIQMTRDNLLL